MKNLASVRIRHAQRLYRLIDPRLTQKPVFEEYLSQIPDLLPGIENPTFFNRPVLMDQRLTISIGCRRMRVRCVSPHVKFAGRAFPDRPPLHWIWCHDGSRRLDISPIDSARGFGPNEFGGGAEEGLAFHAMYPSIAYTRFLDLPESRLQEDPSCVACLGPWNDFDRVWLHYIDENERHPRCGCLTYCLAQDSDPS